VRRSPVSRLVRARARRHGGCAAGIAFVEHEGLRQDLRGDQRSRPAALRAPAAPAAPAAPRRIAARAGVEAPLARLASAATPVAPTPALVATALAIVAAAAPAARRVRLRDRREERLRARRAPAAHVAQAAALALGLAEVLAQEARAAAGVARVLGERVQPMAVLRAQGLELAGQRARVLLEALLGAEHLDALVLERDEPRLLELREQRRGHARTHLGRQRERLERRLALLVRS